MIKNPTPKTLSFFTSLCVSLIAGLISFIFKSGYTEMIVSVIVVFFTSFTLILYALEFFIYRKIKLIYKTIHNQKLQKFSQFNFTELSRVNDPVSDVNEEVLEWAADQKIEMDQLKQNEIFRKDFLGNVSHELKTPIFSIQGYINTLLDGAMEDQEVNIYFLTKAGKATDRLAALAMDLESISQLESGYLQMEMELFDINDLIRDVFYSTEFLAQERHITMGFKEGCDRPFFVEADKYRIREVLSNLIINSIKYGKDGGKSFVGLYDMDENILIEVTDNGLGIEPEFLPRLFERFFRVDKSRVRGTEGGTGLGLSIVKHIIEAHNQTINVRSKHGIGTTFAFTLSKG